MKRILFFLILALMATGSLKAEELHLIVSGKAIHFDDKEYNESNWGLGFEYDLDQRGNWIPFATGASFKDSNKQTSNYLGGGAKRRYKLTNGDNAIHVDAGLVGFLMTRKDHNDGDPFLGALPFVSLGNDYVSLNATYVPRVTPKSVPFVYFQLMFRLAEFH